MRSVWIGYEKGWQIESGAWASGSEFCIEADDETSWGGIYTREGGRSVCLLNVFDPSTGSGQGIEGETWVSIVCGDKAEPVDIPPVPSGE